MNTRSNRMNSGWGTVVQSLVSFFGFGILCVLVGCSAGPRGERARVYDREPLRTSSEPSFRPLRFSEIAIFPLQPTDVTLVREEVARELTPSLIEAFEAFSSLHIANLERPGDVDRASGSVRTLAAAPRDRALAFGRAAGVDGVLFGQISRYVESSGGKLGAAQSAAVSFSLSLLDVASGRVVWTAAFDRQDKPLSENLYELGKPIAFQSTRAMADEGFREAAQQYERERLAAQAVSSNN